MVVLGGRSTAWSGSARPSVRGLGGDRQVVPPFPAAAAPQDSGSERFMSTFSRYILRVFFAQMALLLISFAALLQVFDLLSNSVEVLNRSAGNFSAVLLYAVLRLPEIVSFLTPFVVLMATLMPLGRLERDNEILAF